MVKYGFKKVLILFKKERKRNTKENTCIPQGNPGMPGFPQSPAVLLGDHTPSSAHIRKSQQNLLTMATLVRRLCPSEMPLSKLAQESSLVYADFGLQSKRP